MHNALMLIRKILLSIVAALAGVAVIGIVPARGQLLSTGDIAVYNAAGTSLLGYVSDTLDSQNSLTYTANIAAALEVQIYITGTSPISILELNPPGPNHYVGGVGGSGGYNFASNQDGYAYLAGTALTGTGATPTSAGNDIQSLGYNAPVESTIWSLEGDVLTAQWIDSDSTANPAVVYYDPEVNFLGLTSDLSGYNSAYGDSASAVTFEFTGPVVPEPSTWAIMAAGAGVIFGLRRRRDW